MLLSSLSFLLAALALTSADPFHNGFVAKFSNNPNDGESFYNIPRTQVEALAGTGDNQWVVVQDGSEPFVVLCQPENERFCPIYDRKGMLAGVQVGIPLEDIQNNTHVYPFETRDIYQKLTRFGRETWVGTAFFVSPATLDAGGRDDLSQGTLVELWIQRGPSYSGAKQVPVDPTVLLAETAYQRENCVDTMGLHYYYNITSTLPCEEFDPWFLLYNQTQITGIGFQNFGRSVVRPGMRHYDEFVPLPAVLYVLHDPPQCLSDWVLDDAVISLHMYFVAEPYNVNTPC